MANAGERPHFKVALNLPHAGRIARRILPLLPAASAGPDAAGARQTALDLVELLDPCLDADENPAPSESASLREHAATLGRKLVDFIERGKFGQDRLGQCVRNLFECLELGLEGADISLRAGENPRSMQRPF
jgi:hypothetical protein